MTDTATDALKAIRHVRQVRAYTDVSGETTFEDPSITAPEDRERFFGQWDHVRMYGADFADRLERAGFYVDVVRYARELGERRIRRYGLQESDDIFLCTKPLAKSFE